MGRSHVLVTGATGGLGREVLSRLLECSGTRGAGLRATLLIRGRDDAAVRDRLGEVARYLRRWQPSLDVSSLRAVRGDVAAPGLGLEPVRLRALAAEVSHIVHCAATIDLDLPVERARATNLAGTAEVLRFARGCSRLERLVHVSTAYVAGDRSGVVGEDELDCGQAFLNGYERSKFEAEVLVRGQMRDLPLAVVRPSIIVGHSRDGHAAGLGTIFPVLRHVASGRLRRFPGSGATLLDLVPVDYVADAVVRVLDSPRSSGGTFHLTAGAERSVSVRRLFEMAIAMFGRSAAPALRFGADLRSAPPSLRRLQERLQCYLAYLAGTKTFDDSRYRSVFGAAAPACPDPLVYLPRVLAFARPRFGCPASPDRRSPRTRCAAPALAL